MPHHFKDSIPLHERMKTTKQKGNLPAIQRVSVVDQISMPRVSFDAGGESARARAHCGNMADEFDELQDIDTVLESLRDDTGDESTGAFGLDAVRTAPTEDASSGSIDLSSTEPASATAILKEAEGVYNFIPGDLKRRTPKAGEVW
jgi:hypothetical protein